MASARKASKPRTRAQPKPKAAYVSKHPVKERSAATLRLIDKLRAICMAMPDAVEQVAWGEPTWRIRGRMFAMCSTYHHNDRHLSVHIPAPLGAQAALIESDPERFQRPPYVGDKGWVAIVLDTGPDWNMVASLVRDAYDLIAAQRPRARSR